MIVETKVYRLSAYRPRARAPELVIALVGGRAEGQDARHYTCPGMTPWEAKVAAICRDFCGLLALRQKSMHQLQVWGRLERK